MLVWLLLCGAWVAAVILTLPGEVMASAELRERGLPMDMLRRLDRELRDSATRLALVRGLGAWVIGTGLLYGLSLSIMLRRKRRPMAGA